MKTEKRVRSTPYPYYELNKCLRLAATAYMVIGNNEVLEGDFKKAMGMSDSSSSGIRALTTLELFGLVEQRKNYKGKLYSLTPTAIKLVSAFSRGEKLNIELLQQIALNPEIVSAVWKNLPDPAYMNEEEILLAIRRTPSVTLSNAAMGRAVMNIRDTLQFAELSEYRTSMEDALNNTGQLRIKDLDGKRKEELLDTEVKTNTNGQHSSTEDELDLSKDEDSLEQITYEISLRSGRGALVLPKSGLTETDAQVMIAWVTSLVSNKTAV